MVLMQAGRVVASPAAHEECLSAARGQARFNIACHLPRMAAELPDQPAIVVTASRDRAGRAIYQSFTFAELDGLSNRYANGLSEAGFERGMRVLLMVRPGFEFIGLTFALFKIGAVPVMIDPGMGVSRMLECLRTVDLHGFIGIPAAHLMRLIRPAPFRTVKHFVTVGRKWGWAGPTLADIEGRGGERFAMVETASDETAAILFTSGSTGPAKGVVYEHGMFAAQVDAIRDRYDMRPGEVDLPAFPLFALFSTAMGMTSVIPDMDPSRPARVDPVKIVSAILDHQVTTTFGSPAIWSRVATFCVDRGIALPSLRRILIAGAPVPHSVIEKLHRVLSTDADVHTPYGATESLPVSSISGRELLSGCGERGRRGAGTCVGRPLPGIDLRIIRITDDPIESWHKDLELRRSETSGLGAGAPSLQRWGSRRGPIFGSPTSKEVGHPGEEVGHPGEGEIGEIVVTGPVVTKEYFGLPAANALAKIKDGDRIWHRIGDVGYRDDQGRIWFCGRMSQRVVTERGTIFTDCCEGVFNEHPDVARSALVGVGPYGRQIPVIVIEPRLGRFPRGPRVRTFITEILQLAQSAANRQLAIGNWHSAQVLFHRALPVDVRHNAKINREALALWAAERVR